MTETNHLSDLAERLSGMYRTRVRDGAGALMGSTEIVREFTPAPPIQLEAARALVAILDACGPLLEALKESSPDEDMVAVSRLSLRCLDVIIRGVREDDIEPVVTPEMITALLGTQVPDADGEQRLITELDDVEDLDHDIRRRMAGEILRAVLRKR